MANKVSVEIEAKVQGFQQGMQQASESMKQYDTDTRKISESTVNFKKELIKARKDVMNLAASYSKLDAEAKNSAFGKEMKKQLDEAKQAAAQYIDMQADLNQELKNLASDTRVFDTMAEGIGVVGDITAGVIGTIATFTGEEEDARRALTAFTTAQSLASAAIKVGNALQMQSNTMLAVTKVQELAAAAAIKIKTAAEGKNVVATKAATVAQAMFNKVAMMNPYVLLAMAIAGVVAALGAYIAWSKDAEEQEKREAQAAEELKAKKDAYYNSYNSKMGETMSSYSKLQTEWKELKSEAEKNQWIKDNEKAFHDLGFEINNTTDAENLFVKNEAAVIESFDARARAAAYAAQAVAVYNQALENTPKEGDKIGVNDAAKYGISTKGHEVDTHWFGQNELKLTKADAEKIRKQRMSEAQKEAQELLKERLNEEKRANQLVARAGIKAYNDEKKNTKTSKGGGTKTDKKDETFDPNSLKAARATLSTLQSQLEEINPDNLEEVSALLDKIAKQKEIISNKEIQLGIKEAPTVEIPEIVVEGDPLKGIFNNKNMKTQNEILDAMSKLKSYAEGIDWSAGVDKWGRSLEEIGKKYNELSQMEKEKNEELTEAFLSDEEREQKAREAKIKGYQDVGNALSTVGNAFSSLAQLANDNPVLNVAAIVAQAVANIALAYSDALAKDQTMKYTIWGFLAAAAASVASMAVSISQIHSATGYATGGIVGGSSYSGDNVLARLNSGEMILNQRQQRNLFSMLDTNTFPQAGGTNVTVQGVIHGTDLLLVQKNTNNVRRRSGTQISF